MIKSRISFFIPLLLFIAFNVVGQKTKTFYVNADMKKVFKEDAAFKRNLTKLDNKWRIEDYYLNDTLYRTGYYSDKMLKVKTDTFKYYFPNGRLIKILVYDNNKKNGGCSYFDVSGKITHFRSFYNDEPVGKWIWYDINEQEEHVIANASWKSVNGVEHEPLFPGGRSAYNDYFDKFKNDYPMSASMHGQYGQIIMSFKVSGSGEISEVDVVLHGTPEMDSLGIRCINQMPEFIPARENRIIVDQYLIFPLKFILYEESDDFKIPNSTIANSFFVSGVEDYKESKYDKAAFKFKTAIIYNPGCAKYYYYYAVSIYQYEDPDIACQYFKIADLLDSKIVREDIKEFCKF